MTDQLAVDRAMSTLSEQISAAFDETFRRYVRSPAEGADASDVAIADALNHVRDQIVGALPPSQVEPGPDQCPTCGTPGFLVPGVGSNPDAFIPDDR